MKLGLIEEVKPSKPFESKFCGSEILLKYVALIFCFGISLSTASSLNAEDLESYLVRAKQVLIDRKRIKSISCQYRVDRRDLGHIIVGYYAIDGEKLRRDHIRVLPAGVPKQQVEFSRRMAIVRDEARVIDSSSEAIVDLPEDYRKEFPDYRYAGLTTRPLNMLSKIEIDRTILATFVDDHGAEWKESEQRLAGIPLIAISKAKEQRTESIYFGQDGKYCGCGVRENGILHYVVQVESIDYSRTGFPVKTIRGTFDMSGEEQEEIDEFTDLELNEHVTEDMFEFSGLGLKVGEKVRVRAIKEDGRIDITNCEWDGVQVVDRSKGPN